jgi:hypothetical protein
MYDLLLMTQKVQTCSDTYTNTRMIMQEYWFVSYCAAGRTNNCLNLFSFITFSLIKKNPADRFNLFTPLFTLGPRV